MLALVDLRGGNLDTTFIPRPPKSSTISARQTVARILRSVERSGDGAVARYTKKYDGWSGTDVLVPEQELRKALESTPADLRSAMEVAVEQVRWFHERAGPQDWEGTHGDARMGVRFRPIRRVGVYVPGGRAAYPSTVLMTVVPALVARVPEIVVCTPPNASGMVNQTILAACALLDVDTVFRIGGAQAIAAMAYGTNQVPQVDKIVGPGNSYVAEAKLQVAGSGLVGIDTFAGVTEVMLIADASADPVLVATSLVAQAEHDPLVTSVLVTPSSDLAKAVPPIVDYEVAQTPRSADCATALAGQGSIVLVDDLHHAVRIANLFAPEHLEIQTAAPNDIAAMINAAGTVFVGAYTPTALGDYCAGPNHTLPTGGTARFRGGLTTSDYLVPVNWVEFSLRGVERMAPVVRSLGTAEGLYAHIRSVDARLDAGPGSDS